MIHQFRIHQCRLPQVKLTCSCCIAASCSSFWIYVQYQRQPLLQKLQMQVYSSKSLLSVLVAFSVASGLQHFSPGPFGGVGTFYSLTSEHEIIYFHFSSSLSVFAVLSAACPCPHSYPPPLPAAFLYPPNNQRMHGWMGGVIMFPIVEYPFHSTNS